MDTPIVLFNHTSANLDSPVFELDTQRTVVGIGLQPGDYITFEVITVAPAARAKICGCRISAAGAAVVDGVQELLCPGCESEDGEPVPVKLTAANPVVILDSPQGSLIRAMYYGTGVGLRTVTVWTTTSNAGSLTNEMRGCIPLCCVDDTWAPTGLHRCNENEGVVEVEEISNCGNKRWTQCGDIIWTPTGATLCTDNGGEGGYCALDIDGFNDGPGYYAEVRNQCGVTRWEFVCGPYSGSYYAETGLIRCQLDNGDGGEGGLSGTVYEQVVNPCGHVSWRERGAMTFTETGNTRCDINGDDGGEGDTDGTYENEVRDDCGNLHWQPGGNLAWTATGNFQCVNGYVHIEERSEPCGLLRMNTQGNTVPVTWTATGATRCTATAFERAEIDNCGNTRWVFQAPLAWAPTGNYDCRSGINWRQEANQCGDIRWVNTGEACGTSVHTMTSLTPAAASVTEGQQACWNFTLNGPVVGAPLTVSFDLAGADQVRNNYSSPRSVTLPVGVSSGQLCITTTDDLVIDGTESLCVTPQLSARLTNAPGMSCINVLDNDVAGEDPYNIVSITQTTPDPIVEGQQVCWQFTLSRAVENTPLSIGVVWGGADDARNNYPNSTLTIPVGQSTGTLCLYTTDDVAVDGTEQLCIASLSPNGRIGTVPAMPCVDVLDNDTLPPGDSSHTILSVVPTGDITEGAAGCWLVTLDAPVANSNLTINFNLSGTDQTRHGYAPPSLVIPVGNSSGTVCVTTTDDVVVDGTETLCITAILSGRVTAAPGVSCINVNDNDVAASVHTISCVTPPAQAVEGSLVCWYFELDAPVAVSPLTVTGVLSGTEQDVHGYPNPSVVIPVGQSSGQLCVATTDDTLVEGMKTLCLTFATSARITAITDAPCGGSQASLIFTNVSGIDQTINEGANLNVRVSLSAPAPVGGVSGTITFSGSEKTANSAAYPVLNVTVPEAATFLDTAVPIFDDAFIDGATALYGTLAVSTGGWVVGIANAGATVVDNDFADGGGGGGGGPGGCFLSGTKLRTPTGYVNVNELLPEDELLGFALPEMPTDFDPSWSAWTAPSLAGLSYLATRVVSNAPFTEDKVVVVNGELATTQDHRYFVSNGERYGWVQAKDLNNRYALVTSTGQVAVESVEIYEGEYTFFALDVEAPDTLIAKTSFGDVLAHNRKCADCPGTPGPTGLL